MFLSREDQLVLIKHKHQQMLNMFRNVLKKMSNLKHDKLHITASARFQSTEFQFEITVFGNDRDNISLSIYDFWEVKQSQKLVDDFISAIKSGNFEKVKAVKHLL